jgi:prepilin peptidase CpaA
LFFAAVAVAAAVIDLKSYRIPNLLGLSLVVCFFAIALFHWSNINWFSHIGAALLTFGGGVVLYSLRQMGAGDVKFLSALALWAGIYSLLPLLVWVSLCGFAAMVVILIARRLAPVFQTSGSGGQGLPRVLVRGEGIPFGIGIGPGAIVASFTFQTWLWHP